MKSEDNTRFDHMMDSPSQEDRIEYLLLLTKQLEQENIQLRREHPSILRAIARKIDALPAFNHNDAAATVVIGGLWFQISCIVFMLLFWGILSSVMPATPTMYTIYSDKPDCTRIKLMVNWGQDITASECIRPEEAEVLVRSLNSDLRKDN